MKRFDIDKIYSAKVAEFISNGYVINSASMSGHQGEECKIDLVKGDELLRVWMSREHEDNWMNEGSYYDYILKIYVGRWNHPAKYAMDSWTTVWMKDMEIIEETCFYEKSAKGNLKWYFETREEAMAAQELGYKRRVTHNIWGRKVSVDVLNDDKTREIASRYLKRKVGYKRLSWDHISVLKTFDKQGSVLFKVSYRDNNYHLS